MLTVCLCVCPSVCVSEQDNSKLVDGFRCHGRRDELLGVIRILKSRSPDQCTGDALNCR